jgi:predicted O-methyltransferase YrrM
LKLLIFKILSYFSFILNSKSPKGFGIHSPFVYNLTTKVLNNKNKSQGIEEIENLRKSLLESIDVIEVEDFGAGSSKIKSKLRKISEIAKFSSASKKNGILIYNLIRYLDLKNILELGTSLGIGTAYMAFTDENKNIFTIEGSKSIYEYAKTNFEKLNIKNIQIINGNFDDALEKILLKIGKTDFIYIDGNHRSEATIRYFNQIMPFCHKNSVILFDDISWNKDMRNAWNSIIKTQEVTISIDLYFQGIVFVNADFQKQNFKIRY